MGPHVATRRYLHVPRREAREVKVEQSGYNHQDGQPGYNHQGFEQPGYNHQDGQPGYNHQDGPRDNHPDFEQPGYNHQGFEQPGYNHQDFEQPGYHQNIEEEGYLHQNLEEEEEGFPRRMGELNDGDGDIEEGGYVDWLPLVLGMGIVFLLLVGFLWNARLKLRLAIYNTTFSLN